MLTFEPRVAVARSGFMVTPLNTLFLFARETFGLRVAVARCGPFLTHRGPSCFPRHATIGI